MRTNNYFGLSVILIFAAASHLSWGQAEINIVSPSSTEIAEGNITLGGGGAFRSHFRYPAADFLSLPESHQTISGFAWRPDEGNELFTPVTGPGRVILSTIPIGQPLSLTYEDNLQYDDATLVFDGTLTWQAEEATGPGPRDWNYVVEFNRGFNYDPNMGDLLMEWNPRENWSEVDTWNIDGHVEFGQVINDVTGVVGGPTDTMAALPIPALAPTQFTFISSPPGIKDNPGLRGKLPPGLRDGLPWQSRHSRIPPVPEPASATLLLLGCWIGCLVRRYARPS